MSRNPYEVLQVSLVASDEYLRRKYRKLVMQYHPDHNPGDKKAEELFKEITVAYGEILKERQTAAGVRPYNFNTFKANDPSDYRKAPPPKRGTRTFGS